MNRKRYLFFDIDGTLLAGGASGYIPESTKKAIRLLKEAGHFLAIATGRAQFMALRWMREAGLEDMVSDGGYGLTIGGKLIDIKPMDRDKITALVRECEAKGLPWAIQIDNSDVRLMPDDSFYRVTGDTYYQNRVVPGLDPAKQPVIYKAFVACKYPVENTLESLRDLTWCRYGRRYFFVEPTNKAEGIYRMMEYLHADPTDVIVFGDAGNDLSMFTDEWTNVAMGNAVPELKARADLVTTAVDDDGIYNACVRLGLF